MADLFHAGKISWPVPTLDGKPIQFIGEYGKDLTPMIQKRLIDGSTKVLADISKKDLSE